MLSRSSSLLLATAALLLCSCKTIYSDTYSWKKNNFKAPKASGTVVVEPVIDPAAAAAAQNAPGALPNGIPGTAPAGIPGVDPIPGVAPAADAAAPSAIPGL